MVVFIATSFVISMVGNLLLVIGRMPSGVTTDIDDMGAGMNWLVAAANTGAAALVLYIGAVWSRRPWSEILPFGRFKSSLTVALVLLGLGLSIVMSEADNLLRYFAPMPDWLMAIMVDLTTGGLDSFVVLVIVAPLTEEVLFRGLIMNGFLSRYSTRNTILLSAFLFSLVHLNPYQMLNAFVLGVILGWLRVRTGSLLPCFLLHGLSNGMVFLCMALTLKIPGYNVAGAHQFQPLWFDVTGLVLGIAGALLIYAGPYGRRFGSFPL
jgi:membrane protease YdiL (CAAX protease family)